MICWHTGFEHGLVGGKNCEPFDSGSGFRALAKVPKGVYPWVC